MMRTPRRIHPKGAWMKLTSPDRLRRRRAYKNKPQAWVAKQAGCTQQYISLLETGADTDCSLTMAKAICEALDVDLEDYFTDITPSPQPTNASSAAVFKRVVAA